MAEEVRVLLIEDDEDDYIITRDLLREVKEARYCVEWAGSYDAGLASLASSTYDVVLLDYYLGGRTGIDLLADAHTGGVEQPIIMLTGQSDRDVDVDAMNAGAADYLAKGSITPHLLERVIRYSIQRKRAERERERLIAELQDALGRIKTLHGLVPICSNCKKIRDDRGYWEQVEAFVEKHTHAEFSHSLCPECFAVLYPDYARKAQQHEKAEP